MKPINSLGANIFAPLPTYEEHIPHSNHHRATSGSGCQVNVVHGENAQSYTVTGNGVYEAFSSYAEAEHFISADSLCN